MTTTDHAPAELAGAFSFPEGEGGRRAVLDQIPPFVATMPRPHWSETSPAAAAYRLAEMLSDEHLATPGKVRARKRREANARKRAAAARAARARAEMAEDIRSLAEPPEMRQSHRDYIIAEVEHLRHDRTLDDIAHALGYPHTDSLTRALYRWGRADLARKDTP